MNTEFWTVVINGSANLVIAGAVAMRFGRHRNRRPGDERGNYKKWC